MLLRGEDLKSVSLIDRVATVFQSQFMTPPEPFEMIKNEAGTYSPRNTMNNLTGTEWIRFK